MRKKARLSDRISLQVDVRLRHRTAGHRAAYILLQTRSLSLPEWMGALRLPILGAFSMTGLGLIGRAMKSGYAAQEMRRRAARPFGGIAGAPAGASRPVRNSVSPPRAAAKALRIVAASATAHDRSGMGASASRLIPMKAPRQDTWIPSRADA